jgi:hypothetical protein
MVIDRPGLMKSTAACLLAKLSIITAVIAAARPCELNILTNSLSPPCSGVWNGNHKQGLRYSNTVG